MPARDIDGTRVAAAILAETRRQAAEFEDTTGRKPQLSTVLVGDVPASHTYVRMKTNRGRATGIDTRSHHVASTATTRDVVALVQELSGDVGVDGILVQHPMPAQIDERAVHTPSQEPQWFEW